MITDSESALKPESRQFWEQGAREAGKDPSTMPIGVELFVHVGDEQDARKYVDLWRFTPKAWTKYVNNPDPRDIERQAKQEIPIEEALKSWKIGSDPQVHVAALQQLIDGGVTIIFVHSAQPDQERIIEFYAREVLPKLRR